MWKPPNINFGLYLSFYFFPNRLCIADVGILCSSKQQTDFTEICRFDLLNFKSKLWKVKDTINQDFFWPNDAMQQ